MLAGLGFVLYDKGTLEIAYAKESKFLMFSVAYLLF